LDESKRSEDDEFTTHLEYIRNGENLDDAFDYFSTQYISNLGIERRNEFKDSVLLAATNNSVDEYNIERLIGTGQELLKVVGMGTEDVYGQIMLDKVLELSKGCRVMLRFNLSTPLGLVNGATGTVTGFVFKGLIDNPRGDFPALPDFVMIQFDDYKGNETIDGSIPIPPFEGWIRASQGRGSKYKQLPISLCYGMTIHKSQGLTLNKVKIDLGIRKMKGSLLYVALSRVRRKEHLMIMENGWNKQAILTISDDRHIKLLKKYNCQFPS